jgi:hypothetical protein
MTEMLSDIDELIARALAPVILMGRMPMLRVTTDSGPF